MLKVALNNQGELEDFLSSYHELLLQILQQRAANIEDLEILNLAEIMDFLESNGLALQNGERVHIRIQIEVANVNQILIFEKIEDLSKDDKVCVHFFLQKL